MSNKLALLFLLAPLFTVCIFQTGKNTMYEQDIKISPAYSLLTVPQSLKNQLYNFIDHQNLTGSNTAAVICCLQVPT